MGLSLLTHVTSKSSERARAILQSQLSSNIQRLSARHGTASASDDAAGSAISDKISSSLRPTGGRATSKPPPLVDVGGPTSNVAKLHGGKLSAKALLDAAREHLARYGDGGRDSNYGFDAAYLARRQIKMQEGVSALAEANQTPQEALKLLGDERPATTSGRPLRP